MKLNINENITNIYFELRTKDQIEEIARIFRILLIAVELHPKSAFSTGNWMKICALVDPADSAANSTWRKKSDEESYEKRLEKARFIRNRLAHIELNLLGMELAKELDGIDTELKEIEAKIESLLERQQFLHSRKQLIQSQICSSASSLKRQKNDQDWSAKTFPWSEKIENAREDIFKITEFRPLQLECMNATMSGNDCILIMPTGGGKSLCFQLPAVISKGITLVVSPLISLMEDQLMALKELKINSTFLNSNCSREEVNVVHSAMIDKKSQLKLLYVTPEKIAKSKRFMAKLEKTFEGKLRKHPSS